MRPGLVWHPPLRPLPQVRLQLQSFGFTKGEATKVAIYRGTPLHVLATIVRNEGITGPFKVGSTPLFVSCWSVRLEQSCWSDHCESSNACCSTVLLRVRRRRCSRMHARWLVCKTR